MQNHPPESPVLSRDARLGLAKRIAPGNHPRRKRHRPPRSHHRARRPRLHRGRQPKTGRLPRPQPRRRRSRQSPQPPHGAIRRRPPRTPRHLRARHRPAARLFILRPAGDARRRHACGGEIEIGAIHTCVDLYARYLLDLTPRVCLVVAQAADRAGNLYTGPNTEDTPVIVEATTFKSGIVIAQVNEILDELPRVDRTRRVSAMAE